MKRVSTTSIASALTDTGAVGKAWDEVSASFDRFCLAAGVDALGAMMEKDAEDACGARHVRSEGRRGHRWGRTQGKIGFHAGKVTVERPRVRGVAGQELVLPSWGRAVAEDWLGRWAMNLMLINVSTRKFRWAVRLKPCRPAKLAQDLLRGAEEIADFLFGDVQISAMFAQASS